MESVLIGGRFRLHRLLGVGAMGQVWLATDERLQRSVAVKVVIPDAADRQLAQRLEREARAVAAIQHTNVVRVFDYIEVADGQTLIVMEYVEGVTLSDHIASIGPLPLEDALDITAQICDGLAAAHRVNLVHRDLKPSNVMVTTEGVAKVLDFGIAKRTGRQESNLTMTGAVVGTPRYMAPEQLSGEELTPLADVHAAGLLMYEMLAGRPAFDRENIAELMYQLLHAAPDLTPIEARGVSAEVITVMTKAIAKRPADRWPDARSMADALRLCQYGDVIRARTTPSSAGLRAIIDSGERALRAMSGETTPVVTPAVSSGETSLPAAVTSAVAATASAPEQVPTMILPRPVEQHLLPPATPAATPAPRSRLPLVLVPALVVVAVAAVVYFRNRVPPIDTLQTTAPAAAGPDSTNPERPLRYADSSTGGSKAGIPVAKPARPVTAAAQPVTAAPAPVTAAAAPVSPAATDSARIAEAKGNEIVRRALAAEVEAQWRAYVKLVVPVLGEDISDLKADFSVLVNQAGQLADVRPGTLSEEEVFNDNANSALQHANGIRVGTARRAGGWPMRVRFVGQSVRVSLR